MRTSTKIRPEAITTIEPIVAPTSGMMSNTAMKTPSASEYGTSSRYRESVVTTPQISEMTRLPATYPPMLRFTCSTAARTRGRRFGGICLRMTLPMAGSS